MKLLIFDTETTGLPKSKLPAQAGPNNWPHIVSISWIILDTVTNKIEKIKSYIVKPNNWTIPEDSVKIHGITNEVANSSGVPLDVPIIELLNEDYDAVAAHNLEFDINVLNNAILWDLGFQSSGLRGIKFCTMNLSRDICKLPGKFKGYKPPKLKELYLLAFGELPEESKLHGSLYDAQILTEIIKRFEPLRQLMGLNVTGVTSTDGLYKNRSRTLHFSFT